MDAKMHLSMKDKDFLILLFHFLMI